MLGGQKCAGFRSANLRFHLVLKQRPEERGGDEEDRYYMYIYVCLFLRSAVCLLKYNGPMLNAIQQQIKQKTHLSSLKEHWMENNNNNN